MRYPYLTSVLAAVTIAVSVDCGPSVSQSAAAMEVCADILAQYGIAPEGCDPQEDTKVAKEPEPVSSVQSELVALTGAEQQRLKENNIFFRVGGDKLDAQAVQKLQTLVRVLNTQLLSDTCLRLVGHSDSSGPANLNKEMGLKRANVVAAYLRPRLSDSRRIMEIRSDGEENLIPLQKPDSALHRRVTVYARRCPSP